MLKQTKQTGGNIMSNIHISDVDKDFHKAFKALVHSQNKTIKEVILDFMKSELKKAEKAKAKK